MLVSEHLNKLFDQIYNFINSNIETTSNSLVGKSLKFNAGIYGIFYIEGSPKSQTFCIERVHAHEEYYVSQSLTFANIENYLKLEVAYYSVLYKANSELNDKQNHLFSTMLKTLYIKYSDYISQYGKFNPIDFLEECIYPCPVCSNYPKHTSSKELGISQTSNTQHFICSNENHSLSSMGTSKHEALYNWNRRI